MHKPFVFTVLAVSLLVSNAFSQSARPGTSSQSAGPASFSQAVGPATNGRVYFSTRLSDSNYATYRNGLMEGPYSIAVDPGERVEGEVTYRQSAVNYLAAKRVTYSVGGKPPVTALFELNSFNSIFSGDDTSRRVLSAGDDSVAEEAPVYPFIGIGFGDDPAVIPRGSWRLTRLATGAVAAIIAFDDNGNAIRVRYFGEDGTVIRDEHFPPCGKRKMVRRDANGLGAEQICPLEIAN
jgi:hypothetical protein